MCNLLGMSFLQISIWFTLHKAPLTSFKSLFKGGSLKEAYLITLYNFIPPAPYTLSSLLVLLPPFTFSCLTAPFTCRIL